MQLSWKPSEINSRKEARKSITGKDRGGSCASVLLLRNGREGKGREGKGMEGNGREGKGMEWKGREGKGREGKGREGEGREGKGREWNGRKGREGKGREGKGGKGREVREVEGRGGEGKGKGGKARGGTGEQPVGSCLLYRQLPDLGREDLVQGQELLHLRVRELDGLRMPRSKGKGLSERG